MKKQQLLFLLVIEMLLIGITLAKPVYNMLLLLIFTQLQLFVNLYAWRLKNSAFNGADWVRRSAYFVSYVLAVLFFAPKIASGQHLLVAVPAALLAGLLFLLPRLAEVKPFYNKDLVGFFPPVSLRFACLETYSYIGSAVLQELYYKVFVIAVLLPLFGIVPALVMSAALFVADHLIHARAAMFKPIDYLAQFLLSVCGGVLYVYSGSALVAVLVHLTFNAPLACSFLFRYWVAGRLSMKAK